jgi:hypothetical protein
MRILLIVSPKPDPGIAWKRDVVWLDTMMQARDKIMTYNPNEVIDFIIVPVSQMQPGEVPQ